MLNGDGKENGIVCHYTAFLFSTRAMTPLG